MVTQTKKIVLLNAPPRAGKDTAAAELAAYFGGEIVKFAAPLKAGATAIFCNGDHDLFKQYDTTEQKDIIQGQFLGKTCRQVQIDISESYMKPIHGQDVFGRILATAIDQSPQQLFFVSDSGFVPEAAVLVNNFGAENVILIRIHRAGFDYNGDSRSYINLDALGVKSYDVENPSDDLATFYSRLREIVAYNIGEAA